MDSPPDDLKYIAHYLQRAGELRAKEPVVAYYCNYYAAKLAISKGPKNKETNAYLIKLLNLLEQQKKECGDNEAITSDVVGYAHIENFALKVFLNADNEDRSGKASKKTAKTFMAAATFLELLKTFGDVDVEVEEKIKYAKWKATDIMKAFRDGRVPTPGPPGGLPEQNDALASSDEQAQYTSDNTPNQQLPAAAFTPPPNDQHALSFGQLPPPPNEQQLPHVGQFSTFPSELPPPPNAPTSTDSWQNFPSVPNQHDHAQNVSSSFGQLTIDQQPPLPPNDHSFQVPSYGPPTIASFPSPPSDFTPTQTPPHNPYYDPHQQLPPTDPWNYAQPQQPSPYQQPAPVHFPPPPTQYYQQPSVPQFPSPPTQQIHPPGQPQQPYRQSYTQPAPPSHTPSAPAAPAQLLSESFAPALPVIDHDIVSAAQKHAKWAISALNYDDVKTARENLLKALDMLKNY